jgi:hypothetical protein
MRRAVRNSLLPFFCLLSAACAGGPPEVDRIVPGTPGFAMLPGRVSLPMGSHSTTNCGPETLCAALNYLGISVSIGEVERAVYIPSIKGSVAPQIVDFARRKGAHAKVTELGGLWKIEEHVAAGSPMMIEVTRGGLYHYYLVAGLSRAERVVVVAFYGDRQNLLSFELLEELWNPTRHRSITFSVPPAEKWSEEGWEFLEADRIPQAEESFKKALQKMPDYGPALSGLGKIRLIQGRLLEALELFERAYKAMAGDAELSNNLADALLKLKRDTGRAVKLSEEAVALTRRQLQDFEGELPGAPPGTERRIRDDIDDARFRLFFYYGTLGQALEADGKFARSVEERERSFEFAPEEAPDGVAKRRLETGLLLRAMGQDERASEHFRKGLALAKDPDLRKRLEDAAQNRKVADK